MLHQQNPNTLFFYHIVKNKNFQCRTQMWIATSWNLISLNIDLQNWTTKVKQRSPFCLPFLFDRGVYVHLMFFCNKITAPNPWLVCNYSHGNACWNAHPVFFAVGGVVHTSFANASGDQCTFQQPWGQHSACQLESSRDSTYQLRDCRQSCHQFGRSRTSYYQFNGTRNHLHKFKSPRGSSYQLRSSRNPYINWEAVGDQNMNGQNISNPTLNRKGFGKSKDLLRNPGKSTHHLRSPRQSKWSKMLWSI